MPPPERCRPRPGPPVATDQLVREGLTVEQRDGADRRRTMVALTPQGSALVDPVMTPRRDGAVEDVAC